MAVDEFGREIPMGRGGGSRRPPSPTPYEGSSGAGPSHLYESLPTSRYDRGGDGERGDRPSDLTGREEDRPVSRKRKHHRSESPPPSSSSRRGNGGGGGGGERGERSSGGGAIVVHSNVGGGGGATVKPTKLHSSAVYAEDPMLCQYLWKEGSEGRTDEEYDEYRRSYCLNYVRTFFNEHMDDSWFRAIYSPLEKYWAALQERNRGMREASEFAQELDASLARQISATGVGSANDPSFFVLKARLGGGIRQSGLVESSRHYHHGSSPQKASHSSLVNPVPATHVLALASHVLPIQEVPHFVTNEQLTTALMLHVSSKVAKAMDPSAMVLFSGSPASDLTRTAYLHAPDEVRKEIILQLNHLDRGGATSSGAGGAGATHVPRKEDTFVPKTLELIVECSDAYGRMEVDTDGKGGEPDERGGVKSRKASVWVSTQPLSSQVQVLSAALSSRQRIQDDQEAAFKLAKLYDQRRGIPTECRLETLLPKAIPKLMRKAHSDDPPTHQDLEDALDVTIAYLRRVHLLSFYNGCTAAPKVADVLIGNHAASTIHLRLSNADEILEPSKDVVGNQGEAPKVDLLVQRLNDSIQKALEEAGGWNDEQSSAYVVDKDVDGQAKDIEYLESQVEGGWIEDHTIIDEDGRARCAFHFCRKLFKDASFLKKHLIKKHSEFLRAETAKAHDSYMMKAWDSQEQRPVPPILVDCGHRFGFKPSAVLGAAVPIAADPEPELWRREEERRELAEMEAEARRDRHNNGHHRHETKDVAPSLDAPLAENRGAGRGIRERNNNAFVDVDDMKEEKVEMAFDSVEIPIQPPKKKKKKKLL